MFSDKNPFANHALENTYQKFKDNITELVNKGKMDQTTALQHLTTLHGFAADNKHEDAANYLKTHNQQLGFQPKEAWFKEESWGK